MKVKAIREFNSTAGNAKVDGILDVDLATAESLVDFGFVQIIDPQYAPSDEPDVSEDDDQTDA